VRTDQNYNRTFVETEENLCPLIYIIHHLSGVLGENHRPVASHWTNLITQCCIEYTALIVSIHWNHIITLIRFLVDFSVILIILGTNILVYFLNCSFRSYQTFSVSLIKILSFIYSKLTCLYYDNRYYRFLLRITLIMITNTGILKRTIIVI
jgi:hypothetical protein